MKYGPHRLLTLCQRPAEGGPRGAAVLSDGHQRSFDAGDVRAVMFFGTMSSIGTHARDQQVRPLRVPAFERCVNGIPTVFPARH